MDEPASTITLLKLAEADSSSARYASAGESGASVVSTNSISGPFAMPPTVNVQPRYAASVLRYETAASFGCAPEVRMARAASWPPSRDARLHARGTPRSNGSTGRCEPMIPVEATSTSSSRQPSSSDANLAERRATSRPFSPVSALALPELISTARTKPNETRRRWSRDTSTGAALNALCVNSAAQGQGTSADTSAQSRRPPPS